MSTKQQFAWVPLGSFALALLLSLTAGSGSRLLACRLPGDNTDKRCSVNWLEFTASAKHFTFTASNIKVHVTTDDNTNALDFDMDLRLTMIFLFRNTTTKEFTSEMRQVDILNAAGDAAPLAGPLDQDVLFPKDLEAKRNGQDGTEANAIRNVTPPAGSEVIDADLKDAGAQIVRVNVHGALSCFEQNTTAKTGPLAGALTIDKKGDGNPTTIKP